VRRSFLREELGDGGMALLRAIKHSLDPVGFMNPGALL
jgi:FAD/FMN-containing dehydrogenase